MAACSQAEGHKAAEAEAALEAPVAAPPAPETAARPDAAPPPLRAYLGKHPTEPIQGVSFFHHPDVRAAIIASGVDRDIQKSIFFDDNVVGVVTETRGRLLLHGYDPAGAGSTNWAILMIPDSGKAAVCYSTGIVGYEKAKVKLFSEVARVENGVKKQGFRLNIAEADFRGKSLTEAPRKQSID